MVKFEINLGNLIDRNKGLSKIAIIDDGVFYTYKELNDLADSFANGLQQYGIVKGDRVGILSTNSVNFIAAYLGILRIGAVVVPININLPREQINYILKDSKNKMVLHRENFDNFKVIGAPTPVAIKVDDPAVMLYTSGSSGKPKGVVLSHNHKWTIDQKAKNKFLPDARILISAPMYHMNGLSTMEVALAGHSTIVLMPKFEVSKAITLIELSQVNILPVIPTMMALILQNKEILQPYKFASLKHIILGSAPVSPGLYRAIKEQFPNVKISIGYGLTEVGPGLFGAHPTLLTPEMSVGYPLPGIDYRLVGNILEIRSPSMMTGYNNSTDNRTEDGYFITKDLFRIDENGFYFFLGRTDDMFVSGGNNIYPSQVEAAIESHPNVISAAVVGVEDDIKGMKPYAFVELTEYASSDALKQHILKQLPPSHCPRKIWQENHMPLNGVNKIDKVKLLTKAKENLLQSND